MDDYQRVKLLKEDYEIVMDVHSHKYYFKQTIKCINKEALNH